MSIIRLIEFRSVGDHRGELVALESSKDVPFDIRRVYYMTGMQPEQPRGFHAHRQLQQVMICPTGQCRVVLDNGSSREETWLSSPRTGLLIEDFIWREMHDFSPDCVLLVLASEHYDENDYIRDYNEFLKVCRNA